MSSEPTKEYLEGYANGVIKTALADVLTKDDAKNFVTKEYFKEETKNFVTKDYLDEKLKNFATKTDLSSGLEALAIIFNNTFNQIMKRLDRIEQAMVAAGILPKIETPQTETESIKR
jgi:hypothetical protein